MIQFLITLNFIDMPYLIFISRIYPFNICILSTWVWAWAKSLQSCLTLNTMDHSPSGSSVHGFSKQYWSGLPCSPPGISWPRDRTCISYVSWYWQEDSLPLAPSGKPWKKVKVKLLSCVQLFETPWTVAHQAPLSMGFSR